MATKKPVAQEKEETKKQNIFEMKTTQKTLMDCFFILLGVVAAAVFFVVAFDICYETSFFGWLFSRSSWNDAVLLFTTAISGGGKIYDDGMQLSGFWAPTIIFTLFFLVSIVLLILLITHYVKDYIEVVKGLIRGLRNLKEEVNISFKEAIDVESLKQSVVVTKSSLDEAVKKSVGANISGAQIDPATTEEAEPAKRKPGRPKKVVVPDPEVPIADRKPDDEITDADLDQLLTSESISVVIPDIAAQTTENIVEPKKEKEEKKETVSATVLPKSDENYVPKSLFEDDDDL